MFIVNVYASNIYISSSEKVFRRYDEFIGDCWKVSGNLIDLKLVVCRKSLSSESQEPGQTSSPSTNNCMAQAWSHLSVATASGYHYLYGYSAKSWTKKYANKNHFDLEEWREL